MIDSKEIDLFTTCNKYGYRYNLKHPLIRELYDLFYKNKKIPVWYPLSDNERHLFELSVAEFLKAKGMYQDAKQF